MRQDHKNDRRQFLKKGIGVAAIGSMAPIGLKAKTVLNPDTVERNKFVYRTLGRTGIKLPIVSMGTGATSDANFIKQALDRGIKLLATSAYYSNGNNESVVGEAIKDRGRDSVVVATSGLPDGIDHKAGLFTKESTTKGYLKKLDESLTRLGLEYIDIFFLPFTAKKESVFFEPLLRAMEEAKKQGKAKFIGIATHKFEDEAILAAIDAKIYDVVMTSYNIKQKRRDAIEGAIAKAAQAGMGIIGMKTMAGGYWDKDKTQPLNTKACLKWVLRNDNIHTTIPGIATYEHMEQDIAIMGDLELSKEEKFDLRLAEVNSKNGLFCQQCGKCIEQCTASIDIPTAMRSYMYAYGYRNLSQARDTLMAANLSNLPCSDCDTCAVSCEMGFDVKEKMTDIARLEAVPKDFIV